MPRATASSGRTGRPPATSRAQILTAARRLIDRDGWEKLTIRRLATEAGVGATTLYHHVRDKEDLLIQLLNEFAEQVERPEPPDDPRDRIVQVATVTHDALKSWPWAAEVLTSDGFIARLSQDSLWLVDEILDGAIEHGCTPAQAVDVFRHLWYYTVGEILVRLHTARKLSDADRESFTLSHIDPARLPRLAEVGDQWGDLAQRDVYPDGLRAFVDGLLARAAAARAGDCS
ncbi:TetR/AcrR family transcriptional regulator [Spirillospora sp. NPDC047279]|uniref:TetR/AcrR family transcriptional regulator n=1 Tax=Spirillospora sp. NPDC047279 TaxID=3155478 RepID=UPI0033FE3C6D